eukprot:gene14632-16150_t
MSELPAQDWNLFIGYSILKSVFEIVGKCKDCNASVNLEIDEKYGFCAGITIKCLKCSWKLHFYTSNEIEEQLTPGRNAFEINYRAALAIKEIGLGYRSLNMFSQVLNLLPPVNVSSFQKTVERLNEVYSEAANDSMSQAACEVKENMTNPTDVVDTRVAIDGTWQKRGYSSLNGVIVATSAKGKVLDFQVFSKYCKGCALWESRKDSPNYATWKATHHCKKNHSTSSGAMEAAGAIDIFSRSIEKHKLRYLQYVGDGDTEAYLKVEELKPYGPDVQINKLECVGHVQKRLGTRLRKLRCDYRGQNLSDGKKLSGKGRLTDVAINTMQNYFGMAIRQNTGKLYAMKKAVASVLFHCSDLPEEERHKFCPRTIDSWCKWQKDKIKNTNTYKKKISLPKAVNKLIEPIFRDLNRNELLSKCLDGLTQNVNEAFNQIVWKKCPKAYVGRNTLEMGVCSAVLSFNDGPTGINRVFKLLRFSENVQFEKMAAKKTKVQKAKRTERFKARRKKLRALHKGYVDKEKEVEGKDSYASGFF